LAGQLGVVSLLSLTGQSGAGNQEC